MSTAIKSKGVALSAIFDPYLAGTTKARASGIDDAGNDLSNLYAPLIYGSAGAATGIESQGADLNTLYAAAGTAAYPLAFSGVNYSESNTNSAYLALTCDTTSSWVISGPGSITGSPLSGTLNTYGAVTQVYLANLSYDSLNAAVDSIPQNTWTTITAGLQIIKYRTISLTGNSVLATCNLSFRNASGKVLSANTLKLNVWATNPN